MSARVYKNFPDLPKFVPYNWVDSMFQERLMRLGREYRDYDLEFGDTKTISMVVNATLQEDYVKHFA